MKGDTGSQNLKVGETRLMSPPHSDDAEGYAYQPYEVLWFNDIFILYGNEGCWPNLNKRCHVDIKEINAKRRVVELEGEVCKFCGGDMKDCCRYELTPMTVKEVVGELEDAEAQRDKYREALKAIPHTCHHHPQLVCAGCKAQSALQRAKEETK